MYKERVEELTKYFEKDDLVIEMISDTINLANDYVNKVVTMENSINILRLRLEPYDYRQRVQELDNNRRLTHNALIVSIKALNRVCSMENLEPLFKGNIEDRYEIADWAGELINEIFKNRTR